MPLQPGDPFGRYRIVRLLGQGGMGSVYEAHQADLNRSVALKVLSEELSERPNFRERFSREAQALAALNSPHVIQVYEHGVVDDRLFIATQLVDGPDLRQLTEGRPMPAPSAVGLTVQVASALADVHDAGLVHRDIKPSNILVATRRGGLHAYLCDFGISVPAREAADDTQHSAGTVSYMSPERLQGAEATPSSDIFALGGVLWHLLTGGPPPLGASRDEIYRRLRETLEYQQRLPAQAAHELADIVATAMAPDARARYRDAGTLSASLASWPAGPVDATIIAPQPAATPPPLAAAGRTDPLVTAGQSSWSKPSVLIPIAAALAIAAVLGGVFLRSLVSGSNEGDDRRDLIAAQGAPNADSTTSALVTTESPTAAETPSPSEVEPSSSPAVETAPSTPQAPRTTPPSTSLPPTPTDADTDTLAPYTCWDGRGAAERADCTVPTGFAGMRTVFPGLDSDYCTAKTASVAGKAEVYECVYTDYLVRYSRWTVGYDRYGYYDAAAGIDGQEWWVAGEFAGRMWTTLEPPTTDRPWQWSATYRYSPFSVSVESRTKAGRTAGITNTAIRPPAEIGLE